MIVVSDELVAAARRLAELRAAAAQIEREEKQIRGLIMEVLGEDDRGITSSGAPVVHVQIQNRRGVNRDKLEAMYPEIFVEVVEETVVRVLKIDL
jgi:hypothetical protein